MSDGDSPYLKDDKEQVQAIIRSYNRQRVRELFDCAKQRLQIADLQRRRTARCFFVTGRIDKREVPERCFKPSVFLKNGGIPYLCEEHYAVANDDINSPGIDYRAKWLKSLGERTSDLTEANYGAVVNIQATYSVPDLTRLLVPFIIFHIIGDERLYIDSFYMWDSERKDEGFDGRKLLPFVRALRKDPSDPILLGVYFMMNLLTLDDYQACLLSEGLITDDDLAWVEKAALRATTFVISIKLSLERSVELICHQAAFYSLDLPLSKEQSARLWGVEKASCCTRRDVDKRVPDYDLSRIRGYKKELDRIWSDAKTQARKDQANPLRAEGWREGIRYAYSVELPLDLIEWLNKSTYQREQYLLSRTDLSHLQKKLKAGYLLSKPSEIALEHAARLCGCPPYRFSVSRLWQIWNAPTEVVG